MWWFLFVLGASVCALPRTASAEPPSRDEMRERTDRELEADLAKLAPEALPELREANRLREKEPARALELYAKLHRRFPDFSGATRRMCGLKRDEGKKSEAIALCREAARDATAANLSVLASVLAAPGATAEELTEAKLTIGRALALDPRDLWVRLVQCQILIAAHDWTEARTCTANARSILPPELSAALTAGLAAEIMQGTPTAPELEEAKELAATAGGLAPLEPNPQLVRCEVALRAADADTLKDCVSTLRRIAPSLPATHLYAALEGATRSDWDAAEEDLDRALAAGAKPEAVADLRRRIRDAEPWWTRYWKRALVVLGVWLAGLALLFALGVTLGRIATRAARAPATEATGRATGMSAVLRGTYSSVIALCCAYYYLSIPLVLLLVVSIGGGIVYGIFALGFIAPKLFFIIGFVVLVTIGAMLRGAFVRVKAEDPGLPLELTQHPKLARLLEEVARAIGARNVDRVFIVPEATVSVFERGGMVKQLRGQGERCLIIGAAVLEGMSLGELRAILAHEFGHFSNRDTAGGQFALAVRNSLSSTLLRLAHGGAASHANPAWLFVTGYWQLFLRISQGASRLQEVLADRWATYTYGAENFVRGLRHVVRASIEFSEHVESTVSELAKSKAPLANLYRYEPSPPATGQRPLDELVEEALNRPASPFDSHPPPQERMALVRALRTEQASAARPDDETRAWDLFENQAKVEEQLTRQFCEAVYEGTGIRIGVPG
jgi:Zn-dependent protease with chaperone function/tetratricopeptide (TPR) repeat protein